MQTKHRAGLGERVGAGKILEGRCLSWILKDKMNFGHQSWGTGKRREGLSTDSFLPLEGVWVWGRGWGWGLWLEREGQEPCLVQP